MVVEQAACHAITRIPMPPLTVPSLIWIAPDIYRRSVLVLYLVPGLCPKPLHH
jgi:hypothetical protein